MVKVKNKKGQGMILQLVIAFFVWIAGIMALPLVIDVVTGARNGLSCATPTLISDGTKVLCLIVDTGVPYLIWTLIVIAVGIVIGNTR